MEKGNNLKGHRAVRMKEEMRRRHCYRDNGEHFKIIENIHKTFYIKYQV